MLETRDVGQRSWLLCATTGFTIVLAVLTTATLVIVDKPRFGWLVGPRFLETITIVTVLGATAMAVGSWMIKAPRGWCKPMLLAWAAVAAVSPVFGFMFVLPWSALALSAPAAVVALHTLWRGATR